MNYKTAKGNIFAHATRPSGFYGDVTRIGLAYNPEEGDIWEVHPHGCHPSPRIIAKGLTKGRAEEIVLTSQAQGDFYYMVEMKTGIPWEEGGSIHENDTL